MKIAVSANQGYLDASVNFRFGRAPFFLLVESSTMEYEVIQNPNIFVLGDTDIQSAQLIIERGATTVITGSCGPNAIRVLNIAGIKVYRCKEGTIEQAIEAYKANQLRLAVEVMDSSGLGDTTLMMLNKKTE
jgi:predicted Fe-Mo cluster-binding NifX family protein